MRVSFTNKAIRDLERLRGFVEPKNSHAARRIAAELLDGIGNLKRFPDIGLPVSRAPDSRVMGDFFVGDYTARYLRDKHSIIILRVWHDKESERSS